MLVDRGVRIARHRLPVGDQLDDQYPDLFSLPDSAYTLADYGISRGS